MSMRDAISSIVKPGQTLFLSGAQHGEVSAAVQEIVRQRIGNLTVIAVLAGQLGYLVAEGLVDHVITGYFGQDEAASPALARARKIGKYPRIQETSHFGICLSLLAGQMNVPFIPSRILLGSDMMKYNDDITTMRCPFTDQEVSAIKAVQPDVAIFHCQRADAEGNAQKWGSVGVDVEGIGASKQVIVTTEEIVEPDVIRRHPNLTIVPGFRVSAVVHAPFGSYPVHLAGCYTQDRSLMMENRTLEAYEAYLREFVHGTASWEEYLEKRKKAKGDESYFEKLRIKNPLYSEPIVTGY
jgi:glutaconate CoA-transferase subunit A